MTIHTHSVAAIERAKYDEMWKFVDAYREVSCGEQLVSTFLQMTGIQPGAKVADVGCGTGRAGIKLAEMFMEVTLIDGSEHAIDQFPSDAPQVDFIQSCLWHHWPLCIGDQDFVYCCDVLEHIPVEFTMLVVQRCLDAAPVSFFHISFDPDSFGQYIGQPLHLTQQPFTWWRDRLGEMGNLLEARDMLGHGIFLLERG